jgi:predicted membrane metal-binding protein
MQICQNFQSRAEKTQCFQWLLLPETFSGFQLSAFSFQNLVSDFSAENYSACNFSNSRIQFVNGVNKWETKLVSRKFEPVEDQPVSFFCFPNVSECNAVSRRVSVKTVFKMKHSESGASSPPKNMPVGKRAFEHQSYAKCCTQNFRAEIKAVRGLRKPTPARSARLLAQRLTPQAKVLALAPRPDLLPALRSFPGETIDFNQKASVSPRLGYFSPNEQSKLRFFGNDLTVQAQTTGNQF